MIYTLRGQIIEADIVSSAVVIECGGVGYRLTVTTNTMSSLPTPVFGPDGESAIGESVRVYTYMSVREDAVELFGFSAKDELDMFKLLISVSGVGPKAAMAMLSLMTPKHFALTIASEDTKAISRAPGVGAKTAARVVLELKDKIAKLYPVLSPSDADEVTREGVASVSKGNVKDASDALSVLGYSRSEIAAAMRNIDTSQPVEDIIREALAALMK